MTVDNLPGVIYTDLEGHYVFPTPGLGEYRLDFEREHFTYAQRYLLIEHGRRVCDAKKPDCENCVLNDICPSAFTFKHNRRE